MDQKFRMRKTEVTRHHLKDEIPLVGANYDKEMKKHECVIERE